jgi:hypothetical protein
VLQGSSSLPSFHEKQAAQHIEDENILPVPVEERSVNVFPPCELLQIKVITFSSQLKLLSISNNLEEYLLLGYDAV